MARVVVGVVGVVGGVVLAFLLYVIALSLVFGIASRYG